MHLDGEIRKVFTVDPPESLKWSIEVRVSFDSVFLSLEQKIVENIVYLLIDQNLLVIGSLICGQVLKIHILCHIAQRTVLLISCRVKIL